jgi:hypothetical protein
MWFWPVNRMSLRPGLLWLTLNLALIIHCLSWNDFFFQFYVPTKMFLHISRLKTTGPVHRLRMRGVIPPFPLMPSCCSAYIWGHVWVLLYLLTLSSTCLLVQVCENNPVFECLTKLRRYEGTMRSVLLTVFIFRYKKVVQKFWDTDLEVPPKYGEAIQNVCSIKFETSVDKYFPHSNYSHVSFWVSTAAPWLRKLDPVFPGGALGSILNDMMRVHSGQNYTEARVFFQIFSVFPG